MCIVSLAWQAHPRWKLVAIGNRDEMHARPAEPLERWGKRDHVLAGRDKQAGGTWLGVSEQGRFAVVTNLAGYGMPQADRASRGDLLKDFLSGEGQHVKLDETLFSEFNPFNLVTISGDNAHIHSNRPEPISHVLPRGIHGLSNGSLDSPWPKSGHLNAALGSWIESGDHDPVLLLDLLLDETPYPQEHENITSSQPSLEPQHSPIFIRNSVYGTRCSTVVAIDGAGTGVIIERRYGPSGRSIGETKLRFNWPG